MISLNTEVAERSFWLYNNYILYYISKFAATSIFRASDALETGTATTKIIDGKLRGWVA